MQPEKLFSLLVDSVIWAESDWNHKAASRAGAIGLMQIMPRTAAGVADEFGLASYDLLNPITNRFLGSHYLWEQLQVFGQVDLALAAYNWGPGNVSRLLNDLRESDPLARSEGHVYQSIEDKLPKETREYVDRVLGEFERQVGETHAKALNVREGGSFWRHLG